MASHHLDPTPNRRRRNESPRQGRRSDRLKKRPRAQEEDPPLRVLSPSEIPASGFTLEEIAGMWPMVPGSSRGSSPLVFDPEHFAVAIFDAATEFAELEKLIGGD